jgi:hypothetical protein
LLANGWWFSPASSTTKTLDYLEHLGYLEHFSYLEYFSYLEHLGYLEHFSYLEHLGFLSQPQVIKFTNCLPMVGGSLRLLQPLKLVAMK